MSRRALSSAVSHHVMQEQAAASPPKVSLGDLGQAGGRDALARLDEAVGELKAMAAAPLLKRAIDALNAGDFEAGCNWALKGLQKDERNGVGWYLLGIARERAGDFASSVKAYEAALQLLPDHAEVANDLGRLAWRMGMLEQAEKLFRHFVAHAPDNPEGYNNLASTLKDQGRRDEALAILQQVTLAHPESSILWNTLGTVMIENGDLDLAHTFFSEAARLDERFGKSIYNLSQVKLHKGDPAAALVDCDTAIAMTTPADELAMMRLARSSYLLALSRLGEGWDEYEARLDPEFSDATTFAIPGQKWEPGADIAGKTLLVVAEQGLGDELLFANVLPDIVRQLGPEGRLQIAVERRLVDLFQRSFPNAKVMGHKTYVTPGHPTRVVPDLVAEEIEVWAPIASLLRQFRRDLADYPQAAGYMKADPERIAHWKAALEGAPAGPKVGLLWKSAITKNARHRYYSPFDQWKPVLKTPGVTFVNLQYGDCSEEIAQAERDFGVSIWTPPDIDLKNDLDDLAALCCAMDLVLGFSNATWNIAASCGAPSWLISVPASWPRLGLTDTYAWYPQARVFAPESLGDWDPVMAQVAGELAKFAKA